MNTKLTNILLIILLLFNVAFVGTWWMGHRHMHHPKKEMQPETTTLMNDRDKSEMFLVKNLGLDTLQQKQLDKLLQSHFAFQNKYMADYIRNQNDLFTALKENKDSSFAFHCADSMGILKVAMEKELYVHFLSVKNICNSGQQAKFNNLLDNMAREFIHRHDFRNNNMKGNHDSL